MLQAASAEIATMRPYFAVIIMFALVAVAVRQFKASPETGHASLINLVCMPVGHSTDSTVISLWLYVTTRLWARNWWKSEWQMTEETHK